MTKVRRILAAVPLVLTFAAVVILVGLPTAYAVAPVLTADGMAQIAQWPDQRALSALVNTLLIPAGTTFGAAILGVPMGFALEFVRVPGRRFLYYATILTFVVPSYVLAITWIEIAGRGGIFASILGLWSDTPEATPPIYSMSGAIVVLASSYYPVMAVTTAIGIRNVDRFAVESGYLMLRPISLAIRVVLPLSMPSIGAGALITFCLALTNFHVASLLQIDTLAAAIHERYAAAYDLTGALVQTLPLLATGVAGVAAWTTYQRQTRQRRQMTTRFFHAPDSPRALQAASTIYCWMLILVTTGLPLAILFRRSLPLRSYVEVWQTAGPEFLASVALAAGSATFISILAFGLGRLHRVTRWSAALFAVALAAFLLSGPGLGIGIIQMWNHPGIRGWVYDGALILVIAFVARYLLVGYAAAFLGDRVTAPYEEAADVSGLSPVHKMVYVVLPLAAPFLFASWALAFVLIVSDADTAILVAPPGVTPVSVRVFGLMHYGPSSLVAALSVSLAAVLAVLVFMFGKLAIVLTRRVYDSDPIPTRP